MEKYNYQQILAEPLLQKYGRHYFDYIHNRINANSTVLYIQDNTFLRGYIILKDYHLSIEHKDIILQDFPHIVTIKGHHIPSDGFNCVVLK